MPSKSRLFGWAVGRGPNHSATSLTTAMLLVIALFFGGLSAMIVLGVPSKSIAIQTAKIGIYPPIKEKDSGFAVFTTLEYDQTNIFELPGSFIEYPTDSSEDSRASTLLLYENGRRLGPPHSQHKDIIEKGKGRYVHWGSIMHFSASDNSDPRTNGRVYRAVIKARYATSLSWISYALFFLSLTALLVKHAKTVSAIGLKIGRRINPNGSLSGRFLGTTARTLLRSMATALLLLLAMVSGGLVGLSLFGAPTAKMEIQPSNIGIYPGIKEAESGYAVFTMLDYDTSNISKFLRNFVLFPTDSNMNSRASTLSLYEDGIKLGPPHSLHGDIIKQGRGQFRHWGKVLHFSASDNSDPRTNGRTYRAVIQLKYAMFVTYGSIVTFLLSIFLLNSIHSGKASNFLIKIDRRFNIRQSVVGRLIRSIHESILSGMAPKLVIVLIPLGIIFVSVLIDSAQDLNWSDELSPDAQGYKLISNAMQNPWDTVPRESAFLWIVKFFLFLFDNSDIGIRVAGLFIFYLTSCLVFFIGRNVLDNFWIGAASQIVFLQYDFLFQIGFSGLRDGYFALAVAGLVFSMYSKDKYLTGNWRLFWLCLFFALAAGTRISSAGPTIFLLIVNYVLAKRPLRFIWAPILAGVIVMGPFLAVSYQKTDDALYANNIHASWWRNYEFVILKKTGCKGCPTAEEVKKNIYAGEPLTIQEYMFSLHSADELVRKTISGMWEIFLNQTGRLNFFARPTEIYILYLLGIVLITLRGPWLLPISFAIWINFLAYTVHIGMPARLFSYVGILYSVLIGWSAVWLLNILYLSIVSRRLTFRKNVIPEAENRRWFHRFVN